MGERLRQALTNYGFRGSGLGFREVLVSFQRRLALGLLLLYSELLHLALIWLHLISILRGAS
jgi:hypothetical protein